MYQHSCTHTHTHPHTHIYICTCIKVFNWIYVIIKLSFLSVLGKPIGHVTGLAVKKTDNVVVMVTFNSSVGNPMVSD